jgi:hypothetical protein
MRLEEFGVVEEFNSSVKRLRIHNPFWHKSGQGKLHIQVFIGNVG